MENLYSLQQFDSLKTKTISDGSQVLLSDGISSLNFDGEIPKKTLVKSASEIVKGDIIYDSDPAYSKKTYLITSIKSYTLNQDTENEVEVFLFYYLDDSIGELQYTHRSDYLSDPTQIYYGGYNEDSVFYVTTDDIEDLVVGTQGWKISNNGNAIFSNVFVRGTIEATSGKFDGIVTAGDDTASVSIGKNLFQNTAFFDTDNVPATSLSSETEAHGLLIDSNNYFFTFNPINKYTPSNIVITNGTPISNGTENYYATITYAETNIVTQVVPSSPSVGYCTYTSTNHQFDIGDIVIISGSSVSGYNGQFTITSVTLDTFTVQNSTTTPASFTNGSATIKDNGDFAGANLVKNTKVDISLINDTLSDSSFADKEHLRLSYLNRGFSIVNIDITNVQRTGTTATITAPNHNLVVGDIVYLEGFYGDNEPLNTPLGTLDTSTNWKVKTVNGNNFTITTSTSGTITSNTNTVGCTARKKNTIRIKLDFDLTPYSVLSQPITGTGGIIENFGIQKVLKIQSIKLFKVSQSIETSNCVLSGFNPSLPSATFAVGDDIELTGFSDINLNGIFKITAVTSSSITINTNRITAGTISNTYGYLEVSKQISKFKVGSSTNFMKYDSGLDKLTVTGTINAASGNIGGFTIETNTIQSVVLDTNRNYLTGFDPSFEYNLMSNYWKVGFTSVNAASTVVAVDSGDNGTAYEGQNYGLARITMNTGTGSWSNPILTMYYNALTSTRFTASNLGISAGTYTLSAYVSNGYANNVTSTITIKEYTVASGGTATNIATSNVTITTLGTWYRNSVSFTLNASRYYEFVISDNSNFPSQFVSSATSYGSIMVDAIQLEPGSSVTQFRLDRSLFLDSGQTSTSVLKVLSGNVAQASISNDGRIKARNNIPYYTMVGRTTSNTTLSAGTSTQGTITCSTNFNKPPIAVVTAFADGGYLTASVLPVSGSPGNYSIPVRIYNPTSGTSSANVGFNYIVTQMSASSATG